jgi:hypothetical protein
MPLHQQEEHRAIRLCISATGDICVLNCGSTAPA